MLDMPETKEEIRRLKMLPQESLQTAWRKQKPNHSVFFGVINLKLTLKLTTQKLFCLTFI
jgi:hypothetical protein